MRVDACASCLGGLALLMTWVPVIPAQEVLPPPEYPPDPPAVFALVVPDDVTVATCDGNPVAVDYPPPHVVTDCTSESPVVCDPPAGSLFALGRTLVTCWTSNECREAASNFFTVTVVRDLLAPTLTCPANVIAYAALPDGVVVDYPLPTVGDDADPSPALTCTPPPGSTFPLGSTVVSCVVTDACANVASCTFTVEVQRAGMQIQLGPDPTGGGPLVTATARGFEGMDTATGLGEEWLPLGDATLVEPPEPGAKKFYRPPRLGGVVRTAGPAGEIAYVEVGPLAAYSNPGLNPARGINDNSTDFGTKLLSGDTGGTGNLWSGPLNLGFTFYFFGRPYKQFRVSKNGLLTFSTNIVSNTQGLSYFNFAQSATTNILTNALPLWSSGFAVDNTIFGLAGRYVTQSAADDVYGYVHGSPPYRQVWILFRHTEDLYGRTVTAIVLEQTSNRIFIMDMDADTLGDSTSRLLVGLQGALNSTREVQQVPASPYIRRVATNGSLADNACYLFHPHPLGKPVQGKGSPELLAATNLDLYITEQMRQLNVPGLTVAISRKGRLIFNRAYGYANVEKKELMQPYHRACIGSVSKMFAAFGIEKLIAQGVLSNLQAWTYAPNRLGKQWFWDGVNEGINNNIHTTFGPVNFLNTLTNVTIRNLLSHTAGLAIINDDSGAANAYANGDYTQLTPQQQVRWFMATQPLITNGVGLVSRYSNPSFKQLGVLIEEVTGQNYESWIQAHLLIPGGAPFARLMRTYENEETWRDARRYTYYLPGSVAGTSPPQLRANSPWGTSRISGQFGPLTYGDAIYANAADGAAGSLTATAADLVRFMAAVDGMPNRPDILEPARFNELEVKFFPASSSQGIGWDSVSTSSNRVWKNGNIGYGGSHLMRATTPDRLTVAVVANTGANVTPLGIALFDAVKPVPPVSPFYDLFSLQLMAP